MSAQKMGLGRGLSALIPSAAPGDGNAGAADADRSKDLSLQDQGSGESLARPAPVGIFSVDIDLIVPNPDQPRVRFDAERLQALSESIRQHGVLQPIVVSAVASGTGLTTYQLIAGERRLQAARMAGVERMPVVVREAAGAELLEMALVENMLREDLNPIEEAQAFQRLNDEFGLKQDHIAKRLGRSRGSITNAMRMLLLPAEVRETIASGQISESHARALLSIEDERERMDTWRKILSDDLTVRQAEEIAKSLRGPGVERGPRVAGMPPSRSARVDANLRAIEDDLRHALGVPVSVRKSASGSGTVVLKFHSEDELEGILTKVCGT